MGIFRKKKSITISQIEGNKCMLKCDCIMETSEVCDILLSALCMALRSTVKNGVELEIYKKVAISEIQRLDWSEEE